MVLGSCEETLHMWYWGREEEGSVDQVSLAKGGADKGVLGIVKVKYVVAGLVKAPLSLGMVNGLLVVVIHPSPR